MHPTSGRTAVLVVIVLVCSILSLGGLVVMNRAVGDTRGLVKTLNYNAARGDCIRGVQADADEEFRREISALFDAGRDTEKVDAVRKRMREQPNWADTVKKVCPPSLTDG